MNTRSALLALVTGSALLVGAGRGTAQVCATGPTAPAVGLAGGYVAYDVAGGVAGAALGLDVAFPAGALATTAEYRRVFLGGDSPDTDVLRLAGRYPALQVDGVRACADVHAGLSRFAIGDDAGAVLVGGLGVTIAPANDAAIQPYVSVRGLAGYATGTVLGRSLGAHGFALGVEAGVTTAFGPFSARLRAARDGFDDGLGVTPYPNTAVELAVGYRF